MFTLSVLGANGSVNVNTYGCDEQHARTHCACYNYMLYMFTQYADNYAPAVIVRSTYVCSCTNSNSSVHILKATFFGIWQLAMTPGNCQTLSVDFSNFPLRRPSAALMAKCLAPKVVCVTKIYGYVPQFSATSSCRLFD